MMRIILYAIFSIMLCTHLLKADIQYSVIISNDRYSSNAMLSKTSFFRESSFLKNSFQRANFEFLDKINLLKDYGSSNIIVLPPVKFQNKYKDATFIVNIKKVCFQKLEFMINKGLLNLYFLPTDYMVVFGEPILIDGDNESKSFINIVNSKNTKHNHKIELFSVMNNLSTVLKTYNVDLVINKSVSFLRSDNQLYFNNSIIQGKMIFKGANNILNMYAVTFNNSFFNFYNTSNELRLTNVNIKDTIFSFAEQNNQLYFNNVTFVDNIKSKIILNAFNNLIKIQNAFKGHIEINNSRTQLLFNNAKIENSKFDFNNRDISSGNILQFYNTDINQDSYIEFNGKGNNNISFMGINNTQGNLTFNNDGTNHLVFKEYSNNVLGGIINIKNDDTKFIFNEHSKTELSMYINGYINEFHMKPHSEIMLKNNNNNININHLIFQGYNTISFDLNNREEFALYVKKSEFLESSKINLLINNISQLLYSDNKEIVFKLLKSDSELDNTLNINLINHFFTEYYIKKNKNEIIIVLKKKEGNQLFNNLFTTCYKDEYSVFYKKDFLAFARYLDELTHDHKINSKLEKIINNIYIKSSNQNGEFTIFVSQLFPISNNIIYKSSYDNTLAFLDEINTVNNNVRITKPNIWSKIYHLDDNFILGKSKQPNINLFGNALAFGLEYPINNYLDTSLSLGFSYNNMNNYNYNSNLFNTHLATQAKIFINKNLSNLSSISFNLHNFNNQRYVQYYYNEVNINSSSPVVKSLIFCNILRYALNVLETKNIDVNITPNIQFIFAKTVLSNYKEVGSEALNITGFDVFTKTIDLGISSAVVLKLNKAYFKTLCSVNAGYETNNLASTIYKFTDIQKNTPQVELADYNKSQTYLKFDIGLNYIPLSQIYNINLLLSYKNTPIHNISKISIAISFKI